jgi:hypothetical protein
MIMKILILFGIMMTFSSCDDPLFNKRYTRIYNNTGKTLELSTKTPYISTIIKVNFLNGDSLEYRTANGKKIPFYADSVCLVFEDGKKISFKNYESVPENFFGGGDQIIPKKGKYKNDIINRYFIKPIHYQLAK